MFFGIIRRNPCSCFGSISEMPQGIISSILRRNQLVMEKHGTIQDFSKFSVLAGQLKVAKYQTLTIFYSSLQNVWKHYIWNRLETLLKNSVYNKICYLNISHISLKLITMRDSKQFFESVMTFILISNGKNTLGTA